MWAEMIIKVILRGKEVAQKKKWHVEKGVGTTPPSFLWGH